MNRQLLLQLTSSYIKKRGFTLCQAVLFNHFPTLCDSFDTKLYTSIGAFSIAQFIIL